MEYAIEQPRERPDLEVRPHSVRLRVGDVLHLDVFFINHTVEPVWVTGDVIWGFHVKDGEGKPVDFPGWEREDTPPPLSRDDFVRLRPGQCFGRLDVFGDRLVVPQAGRFRIDVWNLDHLANICAKCHALELAHCRDTQIEIEVE